MFNPFKKKESEKPEPKKKAVEAQKTEAKQEAPQTQPALLSKQGGYPLGVLITPRITEKATAASAVNQYVFEVAKSANSYTIKQAVEGKYGVHVKKVNIVNNRGKKIRLGRYEGRRSGFKKAYVTVAKGETVTLT